ncbi:MAG: hypothetical protein IT165_35370 [Bryobacterales bacterium]|nr:hypothetical protein [Bryobacterales bacterium]
MRRAVSTAYYALFHLLINSAVANWNRWELRHKVARAFEHNNMKEVSKRFQNQQSSYHRGQNPTVVLRLRTVAAAFVQLQEKRHTADYDNGTFWTRTEALAQVTQAQQPLLPGPPSAMKHWSKNTWWRFYSKEKLSS